MVWYEINGDRDVFARKVSNTGSLGSKITIRATTTDELAPTVAMNKSNGSFVVSYQVGFGTGSGMQLYVSEVSSSGAVLRTASAGNATYGASLSMSGSNRYFLTYTYQYSTKDTDIYGRFGSF